MSDCVNSSVGCNGSTTIVGCDGSDIEACLDNILAQANQVCDSCFSVETRLSKVRAILVNMSQFIQDCNITGIRLKEQASSPTTPPSGYAQLYVNTTPAVQFEDDAGTVRTLSDTTHKHAAADITSGTLDNARVNWAAPSAIGTGTAAAATFTNITSTTVYGNLISGTTRALYVKDNGAFGYISSLRELKHNITPLGARNHFMEELRALTPVRFQYNEDDSVHYGFIAEDVEAVNPEWCVYDQDRLTSVQYHELHAVAIAGLQHALDKIDELEAKVARLEKIIDRLDGGK